MIRKTSTMSQVNSIESNLYIFASTTALIIILSFAFYKSTTGEPIIALIDFTICLLFAFGLWLKSRDRLTIKIKLASILLCSFCVLALIYIKGNISSIYWVYPIVTGIFFLVGSRLSLPINIIFIIMSMSIASLNISTLQLINFSSSLILVCISGYIFSVRTEVYQKQLTTLADIDPLTKIKNRHSLEEELLSEIALNKNNIHTSSLLILDLDFFKKINDTYGHTVGDNILISFANMLKTTIRETDKVYRYGGEEFIIIANNTRLEKAGKLAEHLRETTERTIRVGNEPVTVSIGITEVRKEDTETSWLDRADQALYKAKKFNRNIVFLAYNENDYKEYSPTTKKFSL